ncbi:hypothetical protein [Polaribacter sp. Hel1_85]|uniref:hypothetical protein n=1 Tax=Polaribacter sp. Hel1_85 TaxID=1250005 RepID=UPI00052CB117|nr:hypothetical protein [Polaribacter sp. Hel1_85]KGL58670.1 hypothetical protein PHEL85_2935 [Polaribacter sp. Hel1_85]
MKSIKKISIIFLFLFSLLVSAQDEKLPNYFSEQLQLNTQQLQGDISNSFQVNKEKTLSTISLKQIGDENIANINSKYTNGEHTLFQIGDGNNYQFLNNSSQPINLGVLQAGNDNLLKIVGTNSMFQNLQIYQFGGAKMSIINY